MLDNKTKERIAQDAKSKYECPDHDTYKQVGAHIKTEGYISGAEAEATRAAGLESAIKELNKIIDSYWNSAYSDMRMPERFKKAITEAQKKCSEALNNYNNPK